MLKTIEVPTQLPSGMTQDNTQKVPQAEFQITDRNSERYRLLSKNFLNCVCYSGIDYTNGIVFLAHLDIFTRRRDLQALIEAVERRGVDFEGTKTYLAYGLNATSVWMAACISALLLYMVTTVPVALSVFTIPAGFLATQYRVRQIIRSLQPLGHPPESLGSSTSLYGLGKRSVEVDARALTIRARSYFSCKTLPEYECRKERQTRWLTAMSSEITPPLEMKDPWTL